MLLLYMRLSLFEHENMLTTTDFIFSFLRLQAKGELYIILEGHMFERMTQVASTGSLAHMNTQFQQFPTNPLSAPEPILRRHFSDQCDSFRRYLGLV